MPTTDDNETVTITRRQLATAIAAIGATEVDVKWRPATTATRLFDELSIPEDPYDDGTFLVLEWESAKSGYTYTTYTKHDGTWYRTGGIKMSWNTVRRDMQEATTWRVVEFAQEG